MMLERGVEVDHTTLFRWIQHYAPEMEKRFRWYYKPTLGFSWQVEETYVKVKGKWCYLYRAIDKKGKTLGKMEPKERQEKGVIFNGARTQIATALEERKAKLATAEMTEKLKHRAILFSVSTMHNHRRKGNLHAFRRNISSWS